ncbi:MAG: 2-succinyl-5-enolpyruvyl-6-hydroxy-3-cyclohexene-1-carboxylic-acid synthase [Gemmatimonadales bacterium]
MSACRELDGSDGWAAAQAVWARLLIEALVTAGVSEVVISPGSRSTPFVLAAHRHPGLRCTSVLDERSAAFYALGQAKVCGEPCLLICTSGTAGAHYLPAVMEASLSHTPLIILTADRPFELQACGANQTVDQLKLFGDQVRGFFHLGRPDSAEPALRALRRTAAQAVAISLAPQPGPVHLNAPARKPLEPAREATAAEGRESRAETSLDSQEWRDELERRGERLVGEPLTRVVPPASTPEPEVVREVAERLRVARRPLLVCGPAAPTYSAAAAALRRLATSSRLPMAAEATSQLRFDQDGTSESTCFAYFDQVYRSPAGRERLRPDLILQIGGPPASTGLLQLLADAAGEPDIFRVVVAPFGWPDPQSSADLLVRADSRAFASAVVAALEGGLGEGVPGARSAGAADVGDVSRAAWIGAVRHADEIVSRAIDRELAKAGEDLNEGAIARAVPLALPRGGMLALGNSLPVRQVDAWCPPGRGPTCVLSQRGLSGIDGLVSGAAGACSRSGRPTALLIGDVSFLHDVNGLLVARDLEVPFAVVIVNNEGGRLFEELPIASRTDLGEALLHFTTPHAASLPHAADLFGVRFAAPPTVSDLRSVLEAGLSTPGCTVVEARVPASGAVEQNRRVRHAVDEALEASEA